MQKRSLRIAGHNTSITLEPEFWSVLVKIAEERNITLNSLITEIDKERTTNLSSTLRVFVVKELQKRA